MVMIYHNRFFYYRALANASINLSMFSKSSSVSASMSILRFSVGLVAPVLAICSSNWSTQTQYSSFFSNMLEKYLNAGLFP